MSIQWIDRAIKCCGGPIIFYSCIYLLLGSLFVLGSFYLDPDMRPVGIILLFSGVLIFLLFLILAFYSFRGDERRRDPR